MRAQTFPTGANLLNTNFFEGVGSKAGGDSRFFRINPRLVPPVVEEPPEAIIKRMTETPEDVVDSSFTQVTTHLVFNPFSLDSMLATAMLLALNDGNVKKLLPYDHLNGLDTTIHYESLFLVGVELTEHEFTDRCRRGSAITALAYRNTYQYVTDKKRAKFTNLIDIVRPLDEFYYAEQAAIENSVSSLAMVKYREDGIGASRFSGYVEQVGLYTNFFELEPNHAGVPTQKRNLRPQERLFGLEAALRNALYRPDPVKALQELDLDVGGENYLSYVQQTRLSMQRSMRKVPYGPRTNSIMVATAAANEQSSREVMSSALMTEKTVVTYEDTRTFRIWRIYDARVHVREFIAKSLQPLEQWTDGVVLCVATKVPQHNLHS